MRADLIRENGSLVGQGSGSPTVGKPRELLSGIDSLDLTCKVPAPRDLIADLINLKTDAGEGRRRSRDVPGR